MFALGVLQSRGFRDRIKMHLVLVDHQGRSTTRFALGQGPRASALSIKNQKVICGGTRCPL